MTVIIKLFTLGRNFEKSQNKRLYMYSNFDYLNQAQI